ncbi:MAG: hypothetical protein B7Y46_01135 [Acidovorax sp. 28-64-14]|nr:MAG: hypothetical protein B7Y46_01135 [Acidovorax sp. 28-64-14]
MRLVDCTTNMALPWLLTTGQRSGGDMAMPIALTIGLPFLWAIPANLTYLFLRDCKAAPFATGWTSDQGHSCGVKTV